MVFRSFGCFPIFFPFLASDVSLLCVGFGQDLPAFFVVGGLALGYDIGRFQNGCKIKLFPTQKSLEIAKHPIGWSVGWLFAGLLVGWMVRWCDALIG